MTRPALTLLFFATLIGAPRFSQALTNHGHLSPATSYNVRITPTTLPNGSTAIDIGPNLWSVQGFDLRGILAQVYGMDPARIDLRLPAAQPEIARFDVSLPLNGSETDAAIRHILASALQDRFQLSAALERRQMEAYVLTAPRGAGTGLQSVNATSARLSPLAFERMGDPDLVVDDDAPLLTQAITVSGRLCPGISSAGITARAATLKALALTLEEQLDHPLVDETRLRAAFDFQIPEYRTREQLFALLHDRLGLEVTLARRELAILAVHPNAPLTLAEDQTATLRPAPTAAP